MTKPDGTTHKEFWILRDGNSLQTFFNEDAAKNYINNFDASSRFGYDPVIHTIEIGAYQAAIAERDKLQVELNIEDAKIDEWCNRWVRAVIERDKWRKMAEEIFDLLNTHRHNNYCELAGKEEDELCAKFDAMLGDKPEGE